MKKNDYIEKYGLDAWEHHLEVSRQWNNKNKERHKEATYKCKANKPEYYKNKSDSDNKKYAELKRQWAKDNSIRVNSKYRPDLKRKYKVTLTGKFKKYCCDALCTIENYYEALNDNFKGWCIHHRLELHPDNSIRFTGNALKNLGLYYNRPACELIFLRGSEHTRMHHLNNKHGSKYIDTNEITVNSVENPVEYNRQYAFIRWRDCHE